MNDTFTTPIGPARTLYTVEYAYDTDVTDDGRATDSLELLGAVTDHGERLTVAEVAAREGLDADELQDVLRERAREIESTGGDCGFQPGDFDETGFNPYLGSYDDDC
jgi:hypothetical protein